MCLRGLLYLMSLLVAARAADQVPAGGKADLAKVILIGEGSGCRS
jgi:hypothetical protein